VQGIQLGEEQEYVERPGGVAGGKTELIGSYGHHILVGSRSSSPNERLQHGHDHNIEYQTQKHIHLHLIQALRADQPYKGNPRGKPGDSMAGYL